MRRILLLLIALSAVTLGHGQASLDLFGTYAEGYYIDADKLTHRGLVKFSRGSDYIKFKTGKKDKALTFDCNQISGFVIDTDSFTVVRDFEMPGGLGNANISVAFAKVIKTGIVTLYQTSTSISTPGTVDPSGMSRGSGFTTIVDSYLLQREADDPFVRVPNNPVKFKKRLSEYFSDHEVLNEKIKQGTLTYEHIAQIVESYNKESTNTPLAAQSENGF